MTSPYDTDLGKNAANYQPLTPLVFLERSASTFPDHPAIIHGKRRYSYAEFYARSRRLASALAASGIGKDDTEFAPAIKEALALTSVQPLVVNYRDLECGVEGMRIGDLDYEDFIGGGDPDYAWEMPGDEWNAISLNYTSGTTGNPKGVVYHHRGSALMCYANTIATGMGPHAVYLWTLPMFHCNGWCFPWSLPVVAGTHVCLRSVRAKPMYDAIADLKVTHLSGAPFVMSALLNATEEERRNFNLRVAFNHAAAPPPEAVLGAMAEAGFLFFNDTATTETYGPATINEWHEEGDTMPA